MEKPLEILIVEDTGSYLKGINKLMEKYSVNLDFAECASVGLDKIEKNRYDHVVTDIGLNSYEETCIIDLDKLFTTFCNYMSKLTNKNVDMGELVKALYKYGACNEEEIDKTLGNIFEEHYVSEIGERSRNDYFFHAYFPLYMVSDNKEKLKEELEKKVSKRNCRPDWHTMEGVEIAKRCMEKGMSYSLYTYDFFHSPEGITKVILENLADPCAVIAGVHACYMIVDDSLLKEKYQINIIKEYGNEYAQKIVATPNYEFIIGHNENYNKDYLVVLEEIINKKLLKDHKK